MKGQGHWWGHSSKCQCGSSILSTHICFVPCQSALPFLRYSTFKIWPWKSRVKVMGEVTVQSHNVGLTSYRLTPFRSMSVGPPIPEIQHFQNLTLKIKGQGHWWGHSLKSQWGSSILWSHIPFIPCQSALPFLRCSTFKIWPWKSKVKVNGEVTVQSHNVGQNPIDSHPFRSMLICPSILEIQHFQNLTLKMKGQGQMTLMLHNYRSRQFHRTLNGINPSSGFKDMGSARSGPSAAWFDKFLAHGQTHMGQMG